MSIDPLDLSPPGEWPYPTVDEESHLVVSDPRALRARIDMLLEERRELHAELREQAVHLRHEWGLTRSEGRIVLRLLECKGMVTNERLHAAAAGNVLEPETEVDNVKVFIHRARMKLRPHLPEGAEPILTHWGLGYEATPELRAAAVS